MLSLRFVESDGHEFAVRAAPGATVECVALKVWDQTAIPYFLQLWVGPFLQRLGNRQTPRVRLDVNNNFFRKLEEVGIRDGDVIQVLSSNADPQNYWKMAILGHNLSAIRRLIEEGVPLPRGWTSYTRSPATLSSAKQVSKDIVFESLLAAAESLAIQDVEELFRAGEINGALLLAETPQHDTPKAFCLSQATRERIQEEMGRRK